MATAASAQKKRGGSAENDKSNHSAEMSTSTEAQRTGFLLLVGKVQLSEKETQIWADKTATKRLEWQSWPEVLFVISKESISSFWKKSSPELLWWRRRG